jgi:hypothetical protein
MGELRHLLWFLRHHRRIRRELAALPAGEGLTLAGLELRQRRIQELTDQANRLRR